MFVSGKTRFSGTQEIKFRPDPQGIENIPSTPNAPILVTLYYVVVSPTMSRKLMGVEDGEVSMGIARDVDGCTGGGEQVLVSRLELCKTKDSSGVASSAKKRKRVSMLRSQISKVSMGIARDVDGCTGGGEPVLVSRLELCVDNQVAIAIDKKAKDSSGKASSAKKRKRVSKLRSQISKDFKLTLPNIDGEMEGAQRGTSTTFVNFFHSTSGLECKFTVHYITQVIVLLLGADCLLF